MDSYRMYLPPTPTYLRIYSTWMRRLCRLHQPLEPAELVLDVHPSKSQSALSCSEHTTCVATIGIADAPVLPLIIFAGAHLQEEWVSTVVEKPHVIAAVTSKGWNDGYMMKQWSERCFDPYTKFRANGERRLLLLDGPSFHLNVDFLEACWDRDIDLLVLPPNLTSRYQPLDVKNFFATLKLRYNQRIDDFQLGFEGNGAAKGMCYRCIQEAWQEAANPRQIRAAWRDAGIWPLDVDIMDARPVTPPLQTVTNPADTPQTARMMKTSERKVERGELQLVRRGSRLKRPSRGRKQRRRQQILLWRNMWQLQSLIGRLGMEGSGLGTNLASGLIGNTGRKTLRSLWQEETERQQQGSRGGIKLKLQRLQDLLTLQKAQHKVHLDRTRSVNS